MNDAASTNQPLLWLGPIDMVKRPIAMLTSRGTIRTARSIKRGLQRYPDWPVQRSIEQGFIRVIVSCLAPSCKHIGTLQLDTLDPRWSWARVCQNLRCTECGEPGQVHLHPEWHTNTEVRAFAARVGQLH